MISTVQAQIETKKQKQQKTTTKQPPKAQNWWTWLKGWRFSNNLYQFLLKIEAQSVYFTQWCLYSFLSVVTWI